MWRCAVHAPLRFGANRSIQGEALRYVVEQLHNGLVRRLAARQRAWLPFPQTAFSSIISGNT